eukprot:CAMPEP_0115164108 /NCGR_PEP_ID=MMETSP0227-20121206/72857_1 /TAXON_ID=89957 /ORGANISM="Polarella glacialis, Strain CCMP 1383" /LENGTH=127 /DNA_ID=CAMNT_0002576439 /DNA_START=150 /DNA_END=534 /DNA_ORIENTATION=+
MCRTGRQLEFVVVHDGELDVFLVSKGQHAIVVKLRIYSHVPLHGSLESLEVPQLDNAVRVQLVENGITCKLLCLLDEDSHPDLLRWQRVKPLYEGDICSDLDGAFRNRQDAVFQQLTDIAQQLCARV